MNRKRLLNLFLLAVFLACTASASAQLEIKKIPKVKDFDFAKRIQKAIKLAKKKNKRVLIVTAEKKKTELKPWTELTRKHREVRTLLFNEYEVVTLAAREVHPIDRVYFLGDGTVGLGDLPVLLVLDSKKKMIAHLPFSKFLPNKNTKKLIQFLNEQKVKLPKAQEVLDSALAIAKKENKRVFVHLGAPW